MAISPETEARLLELVPQGKTAPEIHQIMAKEGYSISLRTVNYRLSQYREMAHQTIAQLEAETVEAMAGKELDLMAKTRLLEQIIDKAQVADCVPRNPGQAISYFNAALRYRQAERAGHKLYTVEQVVKVFERLQIQLLNLLTGGIRNELERHEVTKDTVQAVTTSVLELVRAWFQDNIL